jgi:predicted O-methyltransferase YrrM
MTVHELARAVTEYRTTLGATDRAVLGPILHRVDHGQVFVEGDNNYTWYDALGAMLRPRSVVEIGVRYGYSLKCLLNYSPRPLRVLAVDNEYNGEKTNDAFEWFFFFKLAVDDLVLVNRDSQTITELPGTGFDVGSVDGFHSAAGCKHDCELVWATLRPGGVLVVDDTAPGGDPRAGCEEFCREVGAEWAYLPTLRGMHLVIKPE